MSISLALTSAALRVAQAAQLPQAAKPTPGPTINLNGGTADPTLQRMAENAFANVRIVAGAIFAIILIGSMIAAGRGKKAGAGITVGIIGLIFVINPAGMFDSIYKVITSLMA